MHEALLQVRGLCSCKEEGLSRDFDRMGVSHTVHAREGTIRVKYDPELLFFVEIVEAVEKHDCIVVRLFQDHMRFRSGVSGKAAGRAV